MAQLQRAGGTYLLKVRTNGGNFVHEILNTKDVVFAELLLDYSIGGDRNALPVDLAVATLVDQLPDGLEIWFAVVSFRQHDRLILEGRRSPIRHIGFYQPQHLLRSFRHLDKDTVVDLEETKELQDFAWFGRNLIDTRC